MGDDSTRFDVRPKVVPADKTATITIGPAGPEARFNDTTCYEVTYFPVEEFSNNSGWPAQDKPAFRVVGGVLEVTQFFEAEQEHVLLGEAVDGEQRTPVGSFRVYSLAPDVYERRALKGDFHIHSVRSDGKEPPAQVAALGREIGMDFLAVTDHRQYAPSLEAQQAFADVPIDLAIYPGEEVHPPDNPVHMINFGGSCSINEMFFDENNEPAYRAEVKKIEKTLGDLPPGVNRYQYASCVWVFERIRHAHGLGMFCHPYWFTRNRYAPSGAITSLLLENQPFDALGGLQHPPGRTLSPAAVAGATNPHRRGERCPRLSERQAVRLVLLDRLFPVDPTA